MNIKEPKRFQLNSFFDQIAPYSEPGRDITHRAQTKRGIFELGTPYEGRIVRFYEYAEWGEATDEKKAPWLHWTLKEGHQGYQKAVGTDQRALSEIMEDFRDSFIVILKRANINRPQELIMETDNELIIRNPTKSPNQLRFTFLKGKTIHGHAYLEPLNASVPIT